MKEDGFGRGRGAAIEGVVTSVISPQTPRTAG